MSTPAPVARLQTMIDDHVDKLGAIGVLVGIDLPGQPRVHLVAGKRIHGGEPLSLSHLFQIGSQTKTFVALAILLLARDGAIGLDDSVTRHLTLPIDARVTPRHLIMNTSGLPEYLGLVEGAHGDRMAPKALVAPALAKGLLFAPGAQFDYSNSGWVIAAMLLDARAPGGYAGFIRDRILVPLALDDTYVASGYPEAWLANGYIRLDGVLLPAADYCSLSWAYGAGDIVSTADDMLDFYRTLARPGNPIDLTLADMTAAWAEPAATPFHPASLGCSYAFGLERRSWGGLEVWGHPGRTAAYGASTWYAPANGAIVTTAFMFVEDPTEGPHIAAQRYNPALIFTQALATAHALHDAHQSTGAASSR